MQLRTLALALAVASAPAWAAQGPGGTSMTGGRAAPQAQPGSGTNNAETNKDDQLSRSDRMFMQDAAGGGMYEVQAAQIAASKAHSPDVKDFAGRMLADHQQANNELVQLANAKKVELPAAPPRGKRHEIESLAKKSGPDFDKLFVKASVHDHEGDVKKFEKAAGKVKDPQLKAWVQRTLPVLREHLAMAKKLEGNENSAAAMGARGTAPKSGGKTGG
jgi:putative membrane protein